MKALYLIPLFPLLGSTFLGLAGRRIARRNVAWIGAGSVALSMAFCFGLTSSFLKNPPLEHAYVETLWTWIQVGNFTSSIGFRLDSLSLVMCLVVTFVGFLIHLYSAEFMDGDPGYSRFFSYMNLFVASMLVLVLADNLLLLYLGWEGVGLCSYLLIGFWYHDVANGYAARKAFVITRVGDTALAIGLFLLFSRGGTLDIQSILRQAASHWGVGSSMAIAASALLLGGAVGKSAQLPLQTWLPDAMAGPTPVSALIHAATMVTAGVYLIARMHTLFSLAPPVQTAVAIIGALTLLIAGFSALVQTDIKRVLAYSTISQIGYMFLALGMGAWSAAIFHFMTHAFFKALLFLSAGGVILALEQEHDIFKMGGLRKSLPLVFWTFLIGSCSLAALPWITAGFYSKDLILSETYSSSQGFRLLWCAGILGAFVTSIYIFRVVFIVFFGRPQSAVVRKPGLLISVPLVILAVVSIFGGFINLPSFVESTLPESPPILGGGFPVAIAAAASVFGILSAYLLYLRPLGAVFGRALERFWFSGWGFDWFYDRVVVVPFSGFARLNRGDFIDLFFEGIASFSRVLNRALIRTQNGNLRWYATAIVGGAVVLAILSEFL